MTAGGMADGRVEGRASFPRYALLCVVLGVALSFAVPYEADQDHWVRNVRHLADGGLAAWPGDLPPVSVLWFRVVAAMCAGLGLAVERGHALKFLVLWPGLFGHLLIVRLAWRELRLRDVSLERSRIVLGLAALSPALLLAGPVWGQIDAFSISLAALAIHLALRERTSWLAPSVFVLAILTKFQMISILPVMGALVLRDARARTRGLLLALPVTAVVLLPFLATGSLVPVLSQAYVETTGEYPYATLKAANLWMLLVGQRAADGEGLFSVKVIGMIAFAAFSAGVLAAAFRKREVRDVWRLATLSALAFFVLLPGMHERYILTAVVMSLLWCAADPRRWPWALGLTVFGYLNVQMVLPPRGEAVWMVLSLASVALLLAATAGDRLPVPARLLRWIDARAWLPEATLVTLLFLETLRLVVE